MVGNPEPNPDEREVGIPSLWLRHGALLQQHGLGVSRQVDSEQATFRVARYPTTIIEHYAIWRFTSASPSKGVSLS